MYNSNTPLRSELPSSGQLLISTALAFAVAAILLVTVVLPSEYGVDPTGLGQRLGLAEMGKIKVALAEEAKQEALRETSAASQAKQTMPDTGAQRAEVVTAPPPDASAQIAAKAATAAPVAKSPAPSAKNDTMTITLRPGQGAEIKLAMQQDAAVAYEWTADAPVNVDMHGEPANAAKGPSHSYSKDRQIPKKAGTLVAAFDGTHGWFWRNRTEKNVTLTVKAAGAYQSIKRML